MIVNLCRNSLLVNAAIKNLSVTDKILDITGVLSCSGDVLQLAELDPDGTLETIAIKKYIEFIGDLSRARISSKYVRQITFLGKPLFWFTPLAEKHASLHWGKDVWMLYTLLQYKPTLFQGENLVLIPSEYSHIRGLLNSLFNSSQIGLTKIELLGKALINNGERFVFTWLKGLIKALFWGKKLGKIKVGSVSQRNIFVTKLPWSRDGRRNNDSDLGEIYDLAKVESGSSYIPFFTNYNDGGFNWLLTDDDFLKSYPSKKQLLGLYQKQFKIWRELRKIESGNIELGGSIIVPVELLQVELLLGCNHLNFLNFLWLNNYFKKIKGKRNIFYSDEFYTTGRIISSAANSACNKEITTYGVQHALISKNHTVYAISDMEFTSQFSEDDGIPAPNYFLVWGNYFKELFLSFNTVHSDFIVIAGNLKYIKSHHLNRVKIENGGKIRILWCTTLPEYFEAEYKIISPVLKENNNYKLTFRLHPLEHIKREYIEELIDEEIIAKSDFSYESDIFLDILNHDIVLTTIFSTSFLDTLIVGRKAVRFITGISGPDDFSKLKVKNLFDVKEKEDFYKIFQTDQDYQETDGITDIDSLCYLRDDIWKKILINA